MIRKLSVFAVDFYSNLCYNIVSTFFVYVDMQNVSRCMQCLHHLNSIKLSLNVQ